MTKTPVNSNIADKISVTCDKSVASNEKKHNKKKKEEIHEECEIVTQIVNLQKKYINELMKLTMKMSTL